MAEKRAGILLPDDLLADVDALAGPQGQLVFLTEIIREEVNRRRLLQILRDPEPILKPGDYPEFKNGSEAWSEPYARKIPGLSGKGSANG